MWKATKEGKEMCNEKKRGKESDKKREKRADDGEERSKKVITTENGLSK